MPLTNAERQARYRQRLKERALRNGAVEPNRLMEFRELIEEMFSDDADALGDVLEGITASLIDFDRIIYERIPRRYLDKQPIEGEEFPHEKRLTDALDQLVEQFVGPHQGAVSLAKERRLLAAHNAPALRKKAVALGLSVPDRAKKDVLLNAIMDELKRQTPEG